MNLQSYAVGVTNLSVANGATLQIATAAGCLKTVISDVSGGTLFLLGTTGIATIGNGPHIGAGITIEGPAAYWVGCGGGTAAFKLTRYFSQGI